MAQWGANSANESKPTWEYLRGQRGRIGNTANVFASSAGWVHRWPWGDELLVAIGDLSRTFGAPTVVGLEVLTLSVSNAKTTNVQVLVLVNEPVKVNGTPTLRAITNAGASEVANLTLSYVAGSSDPTAGRLVFANTTAGALGNTNSTVNGVIAGNGSITLAINATSAFVGGLIVDLQEDSEGNVTPGNVSTTFPNAYAQTISVVAYSPGIAPDGIIAGAQPSNAAAQTVSFVINFNEEVVITGAPTVLAIGTGGQANVTLTYDETTSNLEQGNVSFLNANVDLSGSTGLSLVVNSTSTLSGWSGIVGISGNVAQNTLGISANTRSIA